MDLLERPSPSSALFRLAAEAATGRGRLALIGGEAGVGKTALVRHFSRGVSPEIRIACGGCDPLSLPRPLGPLVDMAPQLAGSVRRLIAEEASAAKLFSALLALLTRAARPGVRGHALGRRRQPRSAALPRPAARRDPQPRHRDLSRRRNGPAPPAADRARRLWPRRRPRAACSCARSPLDAVGTARRGQRLRRRGPAPLDRRQSLLRHRDARRRRRRRCRRRCATRCSPGRPARRRPAAGARRGRGARLAIPAGAASAAIGVEDAAVDECLTSAERWCARRHRRVPARAVARRDPGRAAARPRGRAASRSPSPPGGAVTHARRAGRAWRTMPRRPATARRCWSSRRARRAGRPRSDRTVRRPSSTPAPCDGHTICAPRERPRSTKSAPTSAT